MSTNPLARRSGWRLHGWRRLPVDVAAAAVLTCSSALASLAQEMGAANIIAAQIRTQGYVCTEPVTATRDTAASRPNAAVWVLRCGNASYRVRLVPDMAAEVTRIE